MKFWNMASPVDPVEAHHPAGALVEQEGDRLAAAGERGVQALAIHPPERPDLLQPIDLNRVLHGDRLSVHAFLLPYPTEVYTSVSAPVNRKYR
jgi:hypothetical protein